MALVPPRSSFPSLTMPTPTPVPSAAQCIQNTRAQGPLSQMHTLAQEIADSICMHTEHDEACDVRLGGADPLLRQDRGVRVVAHVDLRTIADIVMSPQYTHACLLMLLYCSVRHEARTWSPLSRSMNSCCSGTSLHEGKLAAAWITPCACRMPGHPTPTPSSCVCVSLICAAAHTHRHTWCSASRQAQAYVRRMTSH